MAEISALNARVAVLTSSAAAPPKVVQHQRGRATGDRATTAAPRRTEPRARPTTAPASAMAAAAASGRSPLGRILPHAAIAPVRSPAAAGRGPAPLSGATSRLRAPIMSPAASVRVRLAGSGLLPCLTYSVSGGH